MWINTGSIIPAVSPDPSAAFLEPRTASVFDDLPSKSYHFRMSRAPSTPPHARVCGHPGRDEGPYGCRLGLGLGVHPSPRDRAEVELGGGGRV